MAIDLDRARAETPGCATVLHLNNAGMGLTPVPVLDAVKEHLDLEARIGGYEAAARAGAAVERVYDAAAELIGAQRDEIAIVENATRAWDMAFYGLAFQKGDRILTAEAEYASNYIAFLQVARRTGAVVETVPSDAQGQLDTTALARMIDGRVKLIAVTHVPTNGGLVNPAAAIGAVARRHGVTPAQAALAWTLRADGVISIPKASRPGHVRLNAAARDIMLTAEDAAALDAAFPPPKRKRSLAML